MFQWFKNLFGKKSVNHNCESCSVVPPKQNDHPVAPAGSNIELTYDDTLTNEEIQKVPLILKCILDTINNPKFLEWMKNPSNAVDLTQLNGLTIEQAVNRLRTMRVDAVLSFYYKRFSSVVGYRNEGENIIHCNRKYHDDYSISDEASNVCHEISHLMGFGHDFNDTASRPYSFPYRINAAFEDLNK